MHWSVTASAALVASLCLSPVSAPELRIEAPSEPHAMLAEDVDVPALPPGHPPLDDLFGLPPGHPSIDHLFRLPPGHPPVGAMGLPPGHPPIGGCPARGFAAPTLDDEDEVVPIPAAVARDRSTGIDI